MAAKHLAYELSLQADKDLEDIFDYTVDKFGITQAIAYVSGFEEVFMNLASNAELGRRREEIRPGLRSLVNERHVVFYRIMKSHIRIVRVLHASRDVSSF